GCLSRLAVRHLPAVDPRVEGRLLEELNIRKVRDLAAIDLPHLSLAFGGRGATLYRQARGLDESPVRPPDRTLSVEADETLAEDSNDDALLLGALFDLVQRCGARLRRLGQAALRRAAGAAGAGGGRGDADGPLLRRRHDHPRGGAVAAVVARPDAARPAAAAVRAGREPAGPRPLSAGEAHQAVVRRAARTV